MTRTILRPALALFFVAAIGCVEQPTPVLPPKDGGGESAVAPAKPSPRAKTPVAGGATTPSTKAIP